MSPPVGLEPTTSSLPKKQRNCLCLIVYFIKRREVIKIETLFSNKGTSYAYGITMAKSIYLKIPIFYFLKELFMPLFIIIYHMFIYLSSIFDKNF